jgi:hypothetical protein
MKVTSCIESEIKFKLKIIFNCNENVSGKFFCVYFAKLAVQILFRLISGQTLSTDQVLPCMSAHQVTRISKHAFQMELFDFVISLSYSSFLSTKSELFFIVLTVLFALVLKKGWWEPWPVEFQSNEEWKWNVDSLKPWENQFLCTWRISWSFATQTQISLTSLIVVIFPTRLDWLTFSTLQRQDYPTIPGVIEIFCNFRITQY